jgi:hypothetical protein
MTDPLKLSLSDTFWIVWVIFIVGMAFNFVFYTLFHMCVECYFKYKTQFIRSFKDKVLNDD